MEILIKVLQFFMSLTLLVAVHEFGHFIVARIFKIRVEKFYIFFDAGFSLWKKKFGDTEYGLGWLPLGGYCKIAGMVDESMDKEQLASAPQPWEYRAKPAWQRFFVLIAGVTMNVVLAFFIYCGISLSYGSQYISNEDMIYGYEFSQSAEQLGFKDGDRIVTIGGDKVENMTSILPKILLAKEGCEVEVIREGAPYRFTLDNEVLNIMRKENAFESEQLYSPLIPFVIDSVTFDTALQAGLQKGDRIIGVGGESLPYYNHYASRLSKLAGQTTELQVVRGADTLTLSVPVNAEGRIGVITENFFKVRTEKYNFFEAIPAGARLTAKTIKNYWDQLVLIVKPDTGFYKQVGGFIAIGNIFPSEWDWHQFWSMTAFLSIILAVMNIIPIPGLDGGHMIFTFWEMVTGRKVSDKVLEVAQYIGMALILALVLFANGNDIYRFFIK
ncbi:MAG: RIP metalloprotease RseP [Alistipes sp.]|nr:RIP metalloprotease RseP [Alistipes sp.]